MPTALITGGGGAIALELARRLERRGYRLVLVDFDEQRMAENGRELSDPQFVKVDLSVAAEVEQLSARLADGEIELDLLVNNAGFIRPTAIADSTPELLMRHIAINLTSAMQITHGFIRQCVQRRKPGGVISIVSAAGLVSLPNSAAYSAGKFGLRGFLLGAQLELAQHGMKFTQVFPGAVDTPMLRHEATHGGSALNFLNKDVLTASQIADISIRAFERGDLEVFAPASAGWTGRLLVAFPGLLKHILPYLEKRGAKNREAFIKSRGLTDDQ